MRAQTNKNTAGFTLLEILIAISIFAIIGTASYRVLNAVILSQQGVQAHSENLRQIQRAMLFMSLDIEQAVNRSIRGPYAEEIPSFVVGQGEYLLQLTRQGWRNPQQLLRSQLQRVAYSLGSLPSETKNSDTQRSLLRHYWPNLDQAQDSQPKTQKLMSGIEDVQLRVLDEEGKWHKEWPFQHEESIVLGLPVAIEVSFITQGQGEIKRLYQLGRVKGGETF
ncbi:MAG: type II secretion system minor pseudopilin GspJ [Pseudomonadales bacterium]|nr:type II secretion system minor pseudopilin GspJ [Pseudomonadales bacterium]MCP5214868.1 type II secretion system minor pseudopilin GspJ [Pseudomonadales bacterium]